MPYNNGYTNTKVIYCHSTLITKVLLLYNTEWQYDHRMAENYCRKKVYNTGSWCKRLKTFYRGNLRHSMVIPSFCLIKLCLLVNYCGLVVNYQCKKFYNMAPWEQCYQSNMTVFYCHFRLNYCSINITLNLPCIGRKLQQYFNSRKCRVKITAIFL
jgi:hypothetical protein